MVGDNGDYYDGQYEFTVSASFVVADYDCMEFLVVDVHRLIHIDRNRKAADVRSRGSALDVRRVHR